MFCVFPARPERQEWLRRGLVVGTEVVGAEADQPVTGGQ